MIYRRLNGAEEFEQFTNQQQICHLNGEGIYDGERLIYRIDNLSVNLNLSDWPGSVVTTL